MEIDAPKHPPRAGDAWPCGKAATESCNRRRWPAAGHANAPLPIFLRRNQHPSL
jgi:hypothetical protein